MDSSDYSSEIVGIDLGTTYCCVGILKNDQVKIIINDQGNRTTPSYVSFTKRGILVGSVAKDQEKINYKNTLFDSKRMIGRTIDDPYIRNDQKYWPFEIVEKDGRLVYKIEYMQESSYFTPEQISSEILNYLKKTVEKYLGKKLKNVVITVPAYFNNLQRQKTIEAGALAGLNVISIINEPTAAAIAYGYENNKSKNKVIIFDLGGGTLDVSLLDIDGSSFNVLGTTGCTHLGGNDFDMKLVEYFAKESEELNGINILNIRQCLTRLRANSEKAKRALSYSLEATIILDSIINDIDFEISITREKFEELCQEFFLSTLGFLDKILIDASLNKCNVTDVVMVGGSTRIPKIQELVSNYFNGKILKNDVNPDEAVAIGAARYAATYSKAIQKNTNSLVLVDVTPLSLGIEAQNETFISMIPANSQLPVRVTKTFTTTIDFQDEVKIEIFEGKFEHSKSNHCLGLFRLTGIPSAMRGIPKIDVTFSLNTNGILEVTAYDRGSKGSRGINISYEVSQKGKKI